MRISALSKCAVGCQRPANTIARQWITSRQRGFTLIEIMLVLVVVGVIIGLATLSLGTNPATVVDREGRRLQAFLNQASEEAQIQGVELALAVSADRQAGTMQYQLLYLDKQELEWLQPEADVADSKMWLSHSLDEQIVLELDLDGAELDEQALDQMARVMSLDTPAGLRPSILILSSGELTPFRLRLSHRQSDYAVRLYSDGFSGVYLQ